MFLEKILAMFKKTEETPVAEVVTKVAELVKPVEIKPTETNPVEIKPEEAEREEVKTVTRRDVSKEEYPAATEKLTQKIAAVARENFKDYIVETNVSALVFSSLAHPSAKPISVAISKDGTIVLAIAVVGNNTYTSMPVVGTKQLVEAKNIPYIRFFVELESSEEYIVERMKEYLG